MRASLFLLLCLCVDEWGCAVIRVAERLREACGVLNEPFHHDAIAVTLQEAADLITTWEALLRELDDITIDYQVSIKTRAALALAGETP